MLRDRKLICIPMLSAISLLYIISSSIQSVLKMDRIFETQTATLNPTMSGQNGRQSLLSKRIMISGTQKRNINSSAGSKPSRDLENSVAVHMNITVERNLSGTIKREKKTEKAPIKLKKNNFQKRTGLTLQQLQKKIAARRRNNDRRHILDVMVSINQPLIEKEYNGYHGLDLMTLTSPHFDPAYKNPCWTEGNILRCLPYVYVIGVKKCGTTDLWRKITQHPDFADSHFGKEAQWFARKRFYMGSGSFDKYIDLFNVAAKKIGRTYQRNDAGEIFHPFITGEASPSNLHMNSHWRYLPGNEGLDEPKYVILDYIHHFIPKAKIIIIFRDPVERLYSDYYHQYGRVRKLNTSPEHFHELMVTGVQLYKECLHNRTLRSCVYDERIYDKIPINIQLGIYHVYWKELTRLFPREQILVLQTSDLHDNDKTMKNVFSFLDMRYHQTFQNQTSTDIRPTNSRRLKYVVKGDMLNDTRRLLQEFYGPYNKEMFRITGDKRFLYTTNAS